MNIRPFLLPALVAMVLLRVPVLPQAPGDVRVALVIGNSTYTSAPLSNPGNDARALGDT